MSEIRVGLDGRPFSRSVCSEIGFKQYADRKERQQAFEEIVCELERMEDSQGLRFQMPRLGELVSIYNQTEEAFHLHKVRSNP